MTVRFFFAAASSPEIRRRLKKHPFDVSFFPFTLTAKEKMQVALAATRLLRKKGGRGGANYLADADARNGTRGRGRRGETRQQ